MDFSFIRGRQPPKPDHKQRKVRLQVTPVRQRSRTGYNWLRREWAVWFGRGNQVSSVRRSRSLITNGWITGSTTSETWFRFIFDSIASIYNRQLFSLVPTETAVLKLTLDPRSAVIFTKETFLSHENLIKLMAGA